MLGLPGWKIGCLGLIFIVVIAFFIFQALEGIQGADAPIDGMKCGVQMGPYHVHTHLTLEYSGRPVHLYPGIGRSRAGSCWYWLHTHDGSGIIHVEGPAPDFDPTLGKFFDVWDEPLSRSQFLTYTVGRHQEMRAYVNQKLYRGNPRSIRLARHTTITLEIGPPFQHPQKYKFGTL